MNTDGTLKQQLEVVSIGLANHNDFSSYIQAIHTKESLYGIRISLEPHNPHCSSLSILCRMMPCSVEDNEKASCFTMPNSLLISIGITTLPKVSTFLIHLDVCKNNPPIT
ncbi:hypothetical protein [Paenibacillus sp. 23TSA30-6]|uniref:hypothetical protein n=1 Tax=Paenibacillus sp. 23TSA30-6 TaxID=2546104 RepID=UPI001787987A|nr:hypothetical protein [Paenibacillus sp. 23TSA30-6]MBE0336122.1 hypothetical protein [Paenibacillus sp. 23TSA30-6]